MPRTPGALPAVAAGLLLPLLALSPFPLTGQHAPSPVGDWSGSLEVGPQSLRVVFHVARAGDGTLTATIDSPDQGSFGIETTVVERRGDTLTIEAAAIGGRYVGEIAGDSIVGTWSQGGSSLPLTLERGAEGTGRAARPQEPETPLPYAALEVTIENPTGDGVRLAGTLTLPEADGPVPGVVLISGSGPQDRDETLMGHRPFLVLSDRLSRRGIAVLRYDDRGVGGSTGDYASADAEDFATDAAAALAHLGRRSEVDPSTVGVVGHSEGAVVGAMVAARDPSRVDFLVSLAGPGVPGDSILRLQTRRILEANGASPATIDAALEIQEVYLETARSDLATEAAVVRARERIAPILDTLPEPVRDALGGGSPESRDRLVATNVRQVMAPWFRFFVDFDPATVLARVQAPVLALGGSLDRQVPPDPNLEAIGEALRSGGNERVTVRELPGLNHLFQHAITGSPSEYGRIEETMAPVVWETVAEWIHGLPGAPRG